jgi:gliding motility-associated-like protein
MKKLFLLCQIILVSIASQTYGQATLPINRTIWNSTPTGWTDSPLDFTLGLFTCSGDNTAKFAEDGNSKVVFFNSAPGSLTFKLHSAAPSGTSSFLVQESSDGINYTTVDNMTLPGNFCQSKGPYSLLSTSRYVKWVYSKGTNPGLAQDAYMADVVILSNEFITTWNMATAGSNPNQLTFNVGTTGTVNYTWSASGGGSGIGTFSGTSATITGLPAGEVITLRIAPTNFNRFYIDNGNLGNGLDKNRLTNINQWGTTAWNSMEDAFIGCQNLNSTATDVPNLSSVMSMFNMFTYCSSLNGPSNIGNWNTTNVNNMKDLFAGASLFNQNISNWNTLNVTNMAGMFVNAADFNQPIGNWNTSNVTDMEAMFQNAIDFNQNIGNWVTNSVTDMENMFLNASSFNQNIGSWNVANVGLMTEMFNYATSFNQNLGGWTLRSGVDLTQMLDNCGMDCANYSATLEGWEANILTPDNLSLGAAGRIYGSGAQGAHNTFTTIKGWTITGDNLANITTVPGTTVNPTCASNLGSIEFTTTNVPNGSYTLNFLRNGTATSANITVSNNAFTLTGLIASNYYEFTLNYACAKTNITIINLPVYTFGASTSQTGATCNGASTGSATVNVLGGTPGYTYLWSPSGSTAATATGLSAGINSCLITDALGCTINQIFNIGPLAIVVTQASQTNLSCFGGSNGAASVNTATGGTGTKTYNWTPGNPTGDGTTSVTGLTSGTWTCTVTDANSCTRTQTFNITQPTSLVASVNSQTNVSCNGGSNGAASVSVSGGTVGYSYNWTPGNPTGDGTNSVTGLTLGFYTCTVTDANGCSITQTFNIMQPTALVASVNSQTNVSCNGGSNGAASVSVSGGTSAYSYNWTPGNPTGDGTNSVTGLTSGSYTCTVTDANGCSTTQTFNIIQPAAIGLLQDTQTNIACFGNSTGSAEVFAPTGGTGSFTYNWTPGNPTGDGTRVVTGLTAGTWTCTVTDANSCTASRNFTLNQPPLLVASIGSLANVSCNGGSNGSALVTVNGGELGGGGSYSYNWTPGNPTGDGTNSVTGLTSGTYTCTVTDVNSCSTTQNFTITEPTALSGTPSSTPVSCFGGSNGAASVSVSGGTAGYTYNWTPGNPTGDGTNSVTGLTLGSYTCTVTDANGCSITQTFNISQPAVFVLTANSQTNVSCFGGSNGAASINLPSGGGGYSYDWSPSNPGGNGTTSASGLTAGSYTCTVTNINGCTATQNFTITQPTALVASVNSETNVSCNGGSNGVASVSVSGGTSGYTYSWSPSGGNAATASGLVAGNYSCQVTDANGCTTTQNFTITEPTALSGTPSSTPVSCFGGSNGTASILAAGGTAGYTYLWSNSATTATATGLSAGTYNVNITDVNGCTNLINSIVVGTPTALNGFATTTNVSCFGGSNGTASVTVTGGTPGYTYSWGNGATSSAVIGRPVGAINCNVTDANGCTFLVYVGLNQPIDPLSGTPSATPVFCFGGTDGTASILASGGTAGYTYLWSNNATTATATGLITGTYSVTVTDANACTATINNIVVGSSSEITATINESICAGTSYVFGPNTLTIAGTYTRTIAATNGCDSIITLNLVVRPNSVASISESICNGTSYVFGTNTLTTTGTYIRTIPSANGCDSVITLNLVVRPNSVATINQSICNGTSYVFGTNTLTTAGTYSRTIPSANGCDSVITLNLLVRPNSVATINQRICAGSSYVFGATTLTLSGTYNRTIPSANGCDSVITLNLIVDPFITGTDVQVACGSYTWIDGIEYTASNTVATFTLLGASGCDSVVTLNLTINPIPATPTEVSEAIYCLGETVKEFAVANSQNTIWYADQALTDSIASGSSFLPTPAVGTTTFFATNNALNCQSAATAFKITVNICDLDIPTAFTPNGDAPNNTWVIPNIDAVFPNNSIIIYDRLGNTVYEFAASESNPYKNNAWDGTKKGENLPVASYYFVVNPNDGKATIKKGTVTIIKN